MGPALSSFRPSPVGSELVRQRSMFRFALAVGLGFATLLCASNLAQAQSATTTPRVVPASLRIRAFGDAVTAGFGVDRSGAALPISDAMDCRPKWIGDGTATTAGTRCSSNGSNGPGSPADEISFSADFGMANKMSWAAQVASQLGAVDFANYAVAGSVLASWLNLPQDDDAPSEGAQHDLLERIERDDPDIVLATIGGEALLQQPAGAVRTCAKWSGDGIERTQFLSCVNALLDRQLVKQRVMAIAFDVLASTQNAKLLFATYLPAEPQFSVLLPWQQTVLAEAINNQIRQGVQGVAESGAAWAKRIDVVDVSFQADRCPSVARPGPSFLGRTWFTPVPRCGVGVPPPSSELAFTPVSFGTVPTASLQQFMATAAIAVIQRQAWV